MQIEAKLDGESEVRIGKTPRLQHLETRGVFQRVVNMEVDEVEKRFEQRVALVLLNLGQRITTMWQYAQLCFKYFPDQIGPGTATQLLPKGQRIQKQSRGSFAVDAFGTPVRDHSGKYVVMAAEQSHHSQMCGEQDTLQRNTGRSREQFQSVRDFTRNRHFNRAQLVVACLFEIWQRGDDAIAQILVPEISRVVRLQTLTFAFNEIAEGIQRSTCGRFRLFVEHC